MSEVSGFTSASPGIGGTSGPEPVAMTMLRVVRRWLVPSAREISTSQGVTIRAVPCTQSTPSFE